MPFDLGLNAATGDLDLSTGTVVLISDRGDRVRQRLESALALIRGEWFLDLTAGIDWLSIVGNKPAPARARAAVLGEILADADVASAEVEVELDRTARSLAVTFRAVLTSGEAVDGEVALTV